MARSSKLLVLLATLGLILAACTTATPTPAGATPAPGETPGEEDLTGQSVTVIASWGGDEQDAFLAMVEPWEQMTGAQMNYTGTRDMNTILATGVASGVLPDLAGLPGPAQMAEYAAAGALQPLDDVLDMDAYVDETSPALVNLGSVDGTTYGVWIKAAVKGLIWYNIGFHDYSGEEPETWDDLMSAAAANQGNAQEIWCLALESQASSGWPGTDWIENILLRQSGADAYNAWYQGELAWTSDEVRSAFELYVSDVQVNAYGGGDTINATYFGDVGQPLFTDPPGCVVMHQASFITGFAPFTELEAGTDYNFFGFPDINPEFTGAMEGAGDLFGMFHDTPAARSLMRYLVTAEAQSIWTARGGAISGNRNVTDYPDDIAARSGELLAEAQIFVFDGSDLMPTAMQNAFHSAMVDLAAGASLDQVLQELDDVQVDAYATE